MNLLRRVKMIYLFDDINSYTEKERFLFNIIKGLIESNQEGYSCLTGRNLLFHFKYNPKNNTLWYSINDVEHKFIEKYYMDRDDVSKFIKSTLEKHFGFKDVDVTIWSNELK